MCGECVRLIGEGWGYVMAIVLVGHVK
jgi:hypothetical protein